MSSEEYDLKTSEDKVGQLYPVILSKDGKVIDGLHRLNIDSEWRTETLEHIDNREKFLKARIIANLHRRTVPASEIKAWINDLGGLALTEKGIELGKISRWIADETGYKHKTIMDYLESKYKDPERVRTGSLSTSVKPTSPPSVISEAKDKLGSEKVKQLRADLKAEVKEELRRDPDFIIEAATTAVEVLPTLKQKVVTPEGYHMPTITEKQKEELIEAVERVEERRQERAKDPRLQKIGKLNRMQMGLLSIKNVLHLIECPICGKPAEKEVGFMCDMLTIDEAMEEIDKQLKELGVR